MLREQQKNRKVCGIAKYGYGNALLWDEKTRHLTNEDLLKIKIKFMEWNIRPQSRIEILDWRKIMIHLYALNIITY